MVKRTVAALELEAWKRAYRRPSVVDPAACPNGDRLIRLALGKMSAEERRETEPHLAACSGCAGDLRELVGIRRSSARRRFVRRTVAVGSALACAAAVLIAVAVLPSTEPEPLELPGLRAARNIQPADGERLAAVPDCLAWIPQPGASGYEVRLLDAQSELLWSSGPVDSTEITLDRQFASTLASGGSYSWTVDVRGGGSVDRLGPFSFTLEAR